MNIELNFDGAAIVTITNLSGMEVLRHDINQMQNVIPVSLEAGTYLVKVSSSDVNSVFQNCR
ncbi:MAG: T9SS type A sorting domain-containing protein [Bacteroidota bacterium]